MRLSAERLWLPVLAPHPVFSWELGRSLSRHPAILGPRAGLVLNPRMSVSVVSVILTAESQLYRKKGDSLLRTRCVLGTFVHIITSSPYDSRAREILLYLFYEQKIHSE